MKNCRNKHIVQITDPGIEQYTLNFTSEESGTIKSIIALSGKELDFIDMLSGDLIGQLLKLLISVSGARRVL
ncbi:hypothetical protein ACKGJO_05115 [Gracilimonas sp. Q87]|uniref:hypothetical protein n=1 Tax=Gracilimonas sp. Q87 TaxID=3384766 RepID=UPI0039841C51